MDCIYPVIIYTVPVITKSAIIQEKKPGILNPKATFLKQK